MASPARSDRSTFTTSPATSSPRLVRESVSSPAWNDKLIAVDGHDRQAAAVEGDAVADLAAIGDDARHPDHQPHAGRLGDDCGNFGERFDEASKHLCRSASLTCVELSQADSPIY